jgi:(p)ppGpp synthase/HD superfamily hydrolase
MVPVTDRPWGVPPPLDVAFASERFVDAFRIAARMHAGHDRWDPSIPFVSHLLGTCAIALEHGASEDQAIAALFHDAIEDVQPTDVVRATIRGFGDDVLRIVEACTDCDEHPSPPWRECKERYLAAVTGHDGVSLLVSASDKLHNARRLVELLRRDGPTAWDRFEGGGADRLWYYRALVTAYRANPGHHVALIDELDLTVTEMERIGAGA